MSIRKVQIVFNDTPSKFNRDLTSFLKRNLNQIITKGMLKFEFKIATTSDLKKLRSNGVKRLPALLSGTTEPIIGVPDIIQFLRIAVKKSKRKAAVKSEEEVLDEYMKNALGNVSQGSDGRLQVDDDDDDFDDDMSAKLTSAFNEARKSRQESMVASRKKPGRSAQPSKPSRDTVNDEYIDTVPTTVQRTPKRSNNLYDEPSPLDTLNQIKGTKGSNSMDDDMMQNLLENLGATDDYL